MDCCHRALIALAQAKAGGRGNSMERARQHLLNAVQEMRGWK